MSSRSLNRNSIRWLILEGTAIVVSILLAFSIEAWWQDRGEREEAQVLLESIIEELISTKEILEWERVHQEAVLEATIRLIRLGQSSNSGLSEADADRLLAQAWWTSDVSDWATPTLDAAIASGSLLLVRDAELRALLGKLPAALDFVRLLYRQDEEYYFRRLEPFYIEYFSLQNIAAADSHEPGHPEAVVEVPKVIKDSASKNVELRGLNSHAATISSTVFQNLMIEKLYKQQNILNEGIPPLDERLDMVIELIRAELARSGQ